jgi:hypothetical protein
VYRLLQDDMKRGTRGGEEVMSEWLSSAGMWEGGNKPAADEALAGAGGKRTTMTIYSNQHTADESGLHPKNNGTKMVQEKFTNKEPNQKLT